MHMCTRGVAGGGVDIDVIFAVIHIYYMYMHHTIKICDLLTIKFAIC